MAIRYDADLNARLRRLVKNFNAKRNRAIKRGFHYLPDKIFVRDLKARHSNRQELFREMELIERFMKQRDESLEIVETSGGAKTIKWEFDYLKANLKYAKEFYDREIKDAAKLKTELNVTRAELLNNLKAKRDYLDLEISDLTPSQFKTYRATIEEFLSANQRQIHGYRNWMIEVETIMRTLGYDRATINRFFTGFEELNPRQFLTMYRQSAIVSRIYELYIPTTDGDFKFSTTEEDARNLIETFMEEKDELIERAKSEG